ncbi:hypothetical protein JQ629_30465 [Bradyrhizobium sp. AUGA SZCCT0222]|uniref:hypothetical protein n=1 Tax=Bradyrhizobium sp. AUGA SZCCT0222 TaxID=2807668 RepID=UPI001BADED94|nr:hypothetical protein [Bradyrhizobium sp. AUGA SZCCT0222]MBR1271817.1 hypothetical protein [Bradyrhizobium sp. AUGA SZCCT0222]
METLLYVLAGWFVFNILFALAMYFRPIRPNPASADNPAKSHAADPSDAASGRPSLFKSPGGPGHSIVTRVLFFGHWLSDRVRSSIAAKQEPT